MNSINTKLKLIAKYAFSTLLALSLFYPPLLSAFPETYYEFKKALYAEEIREDYTLYDKLDTALEGVKKHVGLTKRKKNKAKYQKRALFYYNFAREEAGFSLASDYNELDIQWLEGQVYESWKKFKSELFLQENLSIIEQQYLLLNDLTWVLFIAKINHQTREDAARQDITVLYSYNYLRELNNQEPITSLDEWNQNWLNTLGEEIHEVIIANPLFQQRTYDLMFNPGRIPFLTDSLSAHVNLIISLLGLTLKHIDLEKPSYERSITLGLYNYLRKLLYLDPIKTPAQMSYEWLESVQNQAIPFMLKNEGYKPSVDPKNKNLLEQLKKEVGIEDELIVLEHNSEFMGVSSNGVVGFSNSPDRDDKLFVIYHELGHTYYKDTKTQQDLVSGRVSYQKLFDSQAITSVEKRINSYLESGKKALDSNSTLGKHLLGILEQNPILWQAPHEEKAYFSQLLGRRQEQRADLFALDKLYDKKQLTPILTWIHTMAFGALRNGKPYSVVESNDPHPSDIERALYALGFLADKGIDINKVYNDWQTTGICISASSTEDNPESLSSDKAPGKASVSAIDAAFNARLINSERYNENKQKLLKFYEEYRLSSVKQKESILETTLSMLSHLEEAYDDYRAEILMHNYNFARELYSKDPANSLQEIDKEWLIKEYAEAWELAFEERKAMLDMSLEEQVADLTKSAIASFAFALADPNAFTEEVYGGEEKLVAYNALRKLIDLPEAASTKQVDFVWLRNMAYTVWKDEFLAMFKEHNVTLKQKLMWLGDLMQSQSYDMLENFFSYNMIRELSGLPQAGYLSQIDYGWLVNQDFYQTCAHLKPNLNDLFYQEQEEHIN